MTYVLHDNALSSNAQKVRFLLAELGQTAELREVPFAYPRPDWHLAVNPLGGIPALIHDGFELAESNTVLRYLATARGHADLPLRPPRPRNGQLAARRHRHLPAAGALSHRAGGLRPPGREGARRRAARGRRRQRRLRGRAAQARAIPGPARRRLAVGLLRTLHDRRRGGGTRAAPPAPDGTRADRDPAPRCLGRGLLRAAGLARRGGDRGRLAQRPAGRRSRLRAASRRAPAPAACRATGSGRGSSSRRAAPRARAPDGRTSRARRR